MRNITYIIFSKCQFSLAREDSAAMEGKCEEGSCNRGVAPWLLLLGVKCVTRILKRALSGGCAPCRALCRGQVGFPQLAWSA